MDTNSSQRAAGFVKNKLVSTFFRTTKPPQSLPTTTPYGVPTIINKPSTTSSSVKKVPSLTKLTNFFNVGSDDYVHGPSGGGGDAKVDIRASAYISSFKERLVLEECNATNERVEKFRRN
ncbi:hypothetical protein CTI12_AA138360 [Artemisia annua]|uniref:Uncharacterized protein n=1 Tax=Artemisia annua TaxID=35608 RepID=A0A2U1PLS9_ARTAN|nr:hypothetical protein CTI12_AA138360 [Artemisia annua]